MRLLVAWTAVSLAACGGVGGVGVGAAEGPGGAGQAGGGGGGGDGGRAGQDGGGGAPAGDPLVPVATVAAPNVTAARLSDDGATIVFCEDGAATARSAADLSGPAPTGGPCPGEPAVSWKLGGRDVQARAAAGLVWGEGDIDTRGPAFSLAGVGDGDHVVTAGWDGVYLWDLGDPDFQQRARERVASGPVRGVAAAGPGRVVAFGPDGATLLAVDVAVLAPDVKVDNPDLLIVRDEDGTGEAAVVVQNGGGAPLHITGYRVEGRGLSADVQHNGFDEPPPDVLAEVNAIAGALVTVRLAADAGPGEVRGAVTLLTNDPDEPEYRIGVVAGARTLSEGDLAPGFRLPGLDGRVHDLAEHAGDVVHIKFLNAICTSCRAAIPVLEEELWKPLLAERADFHPYVVHVGRLTRFAEKTRTELAMTVPMPLDLDAEHFQACSQVPAGAPAYPLSLLVDRQGRVRHIVAEIEPTGQEWRGWIEELLGQ